MFEVTTNTSVQYDFDLPIYAAVYAPLSNVKTWGAASDYGSIVGNNLSMYTGWHVDESLSADGGGPYIAHLGQPERLSLRKAFSDSDINLLLSELIALGLCRCDWLARLLSDHRRENVGLWSGIRSSLRCVTCVYGPGRDP